MGWAIKSTSRPIYAWEADPVPFVQKAGWDPAPVWTGAENLALRPGDSTPYTSVRNESLYQLDYPGRRYESPAKVADAEGNEHSKSRRNKETEWLL